MFEVQVAGRDIFVRPATDTWKTLKGLDGRDWIELSQEQALHLSQAIKPPGPVIDLSYVDAGEDG